VDRLVRQGIDVHSRHGDLTAVDLATEGALTGDTRLELRRLPVFQEQEHRDQRKAAREMEAFLASPTAPRAEEIVQFRLRPRTGLAPIAGLRLFHRERLKQLSDHLERISSRPGLIPLAWGVHHQPVLGGSFVDWHLHIAIVVRDDADRQWLHEYLDARYSWWTETEEHAEAAGLAWYLRASVARYAGDFTDENLAEYVRQAHKLHRYQTIGPLRRFLTKAKQAGEQAVTDTTDRTILAPVTPRPPRRHLPHRLGATPLIAACRVAWIGDELRPVVLVRGWRGSWRDLTKRYDLDLAIAAARQALERGAFATPLTLTFTTVNPECTSMTPPVCSPGLPCRSVDPPIIEDNGLDQVP
jgi:hypothetical protein